MCMYLDVCMYLCLILNWPNVLQISLSDSGETVDASAYGVPDVPILLDDVKCTGSESNILSCPQLPLNETHNCRHNEDVAIICAGEEQMSCY